MEIVLKISKTMKEMEDLPRRLVMQVEALPLPMKIPLGALEETLEMEAHLILLVALEEIL